MVFVLLLEETVASGSIIIHRGGHRCQKNDDIFANLGETT